MHAALGRLQERLDWRRFSGQRQLSLAESSHAPGSHASVHDPELGQRPELHRRQTEGRTNERDSQME